MLDITCRMKREMLQSADDVVPIEARLAVAVPEDDIYSLIDFGVGGYWNRVTVDRVGWDICRHDKTSECGFDQLQTALIILDDQDPEYLRLHEKMACNPLGGPSDWSRRDTDSAELHAYIERRLASFDRPRTPSDLLLIDLMDEARHHDWAPSDHITAELMRLEAIATAKRDELAAAWNIEADTKAEAKHQAWLAEEAQAEVERDAIHKRLDAADDWPMDTDQEVERYRAIERQYDAEMDVWIETYGRRFWPEKYDPATIAARDKWHDGQMAALKRKPRLEIIEADLSNLRLRDRLQLENEIMIARSANLSVVPAVSQPNLLKSSAEFVHGFVPPEYLLDGVLQRRFCYSLTAQTGVGKTTVAMLLSALVATGRPLGSLDIAQGTVLYFAGENPTDIQMRWLGLTRELDIDPATADIHFIPGAMPLSAVAARIGAEVAAKRLNLALVVVDTAAAYFEGDNENDNAQAVGHARRMRSLTELPGGPTVLVLCHPTKRAGEDDLIPRGGGAFLAEVDGNIALQKRESLVVASVQGKFRGREFAPLSFELKTVLHPVLKDARGRDIPTVIARPIDETGKATMSAANRRAEDDLLKAIYEQPGASLRALAGHLRWLDSRQQPNAMKVSRAADVLAREKLVRKHRGTWQLTAAGEVELNKLDRPANNTYPLNPTVTSHVTGPQQLPPIPGR